MKIKPKFVYVIYIETTPAELWKALTTTDLIRQYWADRTNTSTWKKGAPIESRSPEDELEWQGKVLEIKRHRRLVYTFDVVSRKEGPSRVTFEIEPPKRSSAQRKSVLKLTVTHDQFPPRSKVFLGVSEGWPSILSSLKSLLEVGRAIRFID